MTYDAIEWCLEHHEEDCGLCHDTEDELGTLQQARDELTHAREALVVLEKVARARHNWKLSNGVRCSGSFDSCPDELCTEARQVMGK